MVGMVQNVSIQPIPATFRGNFDKPPVLYPELYAKPG